ncbi:MAG: hypothetical protein AB7I04_21975 [Pseudomonadales bacterium]
MEAIRGPLWRGVNWSSDAGAGSIHDDATAGKLGFRGGTVAGDIHMNQFPPVLLKIFGDEWFRTGNLSLDFKAATVDREPVQVCAEALAAGASQTRVWMERDDGMLVCTGTAAVGDHSRSALRAKDLRACDPASLRILRELHAGMPLGHFELELDPTLQFERYDKGLISDPLEAYRTDTGWGAPVAAPCTFVQYFWGPPTRDLRSLVGEAVGLFGAIEIGHVDGPLLLNRPYLIDSEVVCVGESPQTEYFWFDTTAKRPDGTLVATFRMMLRFMKASSPLYGPV